MCGIRRRTEYISIKFRIRIYTFSKYDISYIFSTISSGELRESRNTFDLLSANNCIVFGLIILEDGCYSFDMNYKWGRIHTYIYIYTYRYKLLEFHHIYRTLYLKYLWIFLPYLLQHLILYLTSILYLVNLTSYIILLVFSITSVINYGLLHWHFL